MTVKIGFIGIGLMGLPMCKRLLAAGYSLVIWNRTPAKCAELAALGAIVCENPAEVAKSADLLMMCLADAKAITDIVFGENGIISISKPGLRLIDFSSTDPTTTKNAATKLLECSGIYWIDCPVSGGVVGAETGQLVMMAGGREEDVEFIRPFVSPLGIRLTYMGALGAGQVTKICNQLIVAANALLIAEAVSLATAAGVDANALASALAGGFADSKPFQILAPRMAAKQFEPVQWRVQTLLKDLDNAVQLANGVKVPIQVAQKARELMQQHASDGHATEDLSSVIEIYSC